MKIVLQRVKQASVEVKGQTVGKIQQGALIYLCLMTGDSAEKVKFVAKKIAEFRMFHDEDQKMNRSLLDIQGQALVISQFTLVANGKKGKRPSFDLALEPKTAEILYEQFIQELKVDIDTTMEFWRIYASNSQNDGPVTFMFEF